MSNNNQNIPGQNSAPSAAAQAQAALQQALAYHQKGQLAQAQALYESLLRIQPRHFDGLQLFGYLAYQTNRHQMAVELISQAIAINPRFATPYSNLGLALQALQRYDEALANYNQAIALDPNFIEAYNNRGNVLQTLKRFDEALVSYNRAIALKPDYAEAYNGRGVVLADLQRPNEAIASYDKAIALRPDYAEAYANRGTTLNVLKRLDEALISYDRAIALKPGYAAAYNNRGATLNDLGRLDEALVSYDRAIALKPDFAEAYNNRGNTLKNLKRYDEALVSYERAITLNPSFVDAYNNRGNALSDLKRLDEALVSYDQAITLNPNFVEAHNNRGNALRDLKRSDEALVSYAKAIALKPDYAEAYNNRGVALNYLQRPDESLASYERAIALKPDFAEAHNNRGNALNALKRLDEAVVSYDQAIRLKSDYAEAYNSLGATLYGLKRLDDAVISYDQAIALKPDYAEAYNNRGAALKALQRLDEALASYGKAIALKPDHEFLLGTLLHTKMMVCDWQGLEENLNNYEADVHASKKTTLPFPALALLDSPELHKQAARIFADTRFPKVEHLGVIEKRAKGDRIRIGYYSADFHNHATTFLMAGLFEAHDAEKFELFGFSFGPNTLDEMRKRVSSAFDHFFDVSNKSDRDIARQSRELGIDIAIDLKGFTADSRMGIFAERCAPIQVNYLGYPGTVGAEYFEYIIADTTVIPKERQSDYTEKVVYLPHSYQVNDSKRRISERVFTKQELGLPESGFVFCCFNNNFKILPSTFAVWMRILKAVDGSVLWLFEDNPTAAKNLRQEAETRGVDSSRLIFAKRASLDEHLARHRMADLFIDTLPYNAHTTASDALWVGLPVLTCMGQSFASRVAASLLNAIELPELVTHTEAEYEAKAVELASNPEKLADIKRKLESNRLTTPLFDAALFAQHIESAYEAMYERYQAGLAPDSIEVKARD